MAADANKRDTGSEYAGSKAPEVRKEAQEPAPFSDERLRPGGPLGSPADVGMSGFDREQAPQRPRNTG